MSLAPVPTLAVGLHPDRPLTEVGDLAVSAERLGFEALWIADSQSLFRDAYAALALAAERTSAIRLGTGVTNPITRHPAVIAGGLGSLAELAGPGRMVLGIGTGETAVESIGRKRATIARMEETARVVRGLQSGAEVEHGEATLRLGWPSPTVPIVFASSGPKSLRAAGRSGDGVYLKLGVHPEVLGWARDRLAEGRGDAGTTMEGYRVHAMVPVAVDDDPAAARDEVRGFAAAIARAAARAIPPEHLPAELGELIAELERVSSEARERQSYVEWLHSPEYAQLIPDEIVRSFAIAGTAEEVARRVVELGAHGIDEVIAPLTMADPAPVLERIGTDVLPLLRASA